MNQCTNCVVECEAVALRERAERAERERDELAAQLLDMAATAKYEAGEYSERVAQLVAQNERLREALTNVSEWWGNWMPDEAYAQGGNDALVIARIALAETPATSLDALGAAMQAKAWREAGEWLYEIGLYDCSREALDRAAGGTNDAR